MIEAIQAGLTASALFLFAIMIVALVAFAAAPVMKEAWTKWRKRGKLDKVVSLVAVGIAIAYGGSKSHDVPNAGADDGIALVGISAEYDSTNDVTAVNVKYTAGDVTVSTPVSVRNAENEQWRALEKIAATVTTGQTNVLAFAVAGNAATNRYWWVGVDTPAVIIESQDITITNYVATSKSVRIDWTCDDPKATVFAVQRKRKKPAGIPYDAEVEYLESTGTQWIDTGYVYNADSKFVCDAMLMSVPSDTFATMFGAMQSYQGVFIALNNTVPIQARFGANSVGNIVSDLSVQNAVGVRHKYELSARRLAIDDNVFTRSNFTPYTVNRTIWLCSCNDSVSGNLNRRPCSLRVYAFDIYNGNALVRDYIPVRIGTTGAIYDKRGVGGMNSDGTAQNDGLYFNRGTGNFGYGNDTLSYDWETVDTTSANTYTFEGFTVGEDWEWRIMSTYTEGDE